MAASVTSRSDFSTSNSSIRNGSSNHGNNNNKKGSGLFSVPRRRPSYGGESASAVVNKLNRWSSSNSSNNRQPKSQEQLPRKRPREERERTGDARQHVKSSISSSNSRGRDGEHNVNNNNTTHTSVSIHSTTTTTKPKKIHTTSNRRDSLETTSSSGSSNKTGSESRRSSISSTKSSSDNKSERRSSMSSVKSTTSNNSGGGFRRLKKFSSSSDKKKQPASPPSSPVVKKKKKKQHKAAEEKDDDVADDDLSCVSDTFQQTQLRLWKAAQERNRKMQEEQEQKRLKKLRKKQKKERQLQQQQRQAAAEEKEETIPKKKKSKETQVRDANVSSSSKGEPGKSAAVKKGERTEPLEKVKSSKTATAPTLGVSSTDVLDREALRERKRLKKLKKQQRLAEAELAAKKASKLHDETHATTATSTDSPLKQPKASYTQSTIVSEAVVKKQMVPSKGPDEVRPAKGLATHSNETTTREPVATKDPSTVDEFRPSKAKAEIRSVPSLAPSSVVKDHVSIARPTTSAAATTDEEARKKKKKKRRLVKMGSSGQDDEAPPRKKKKKRIIIESDDEAAPAPAQATDDRKKEAARRSSTNNPSLSSIEVPATPERKPSKAIDWIASPSTPSSFGLADTVKTRVRSCTKVKDELELLQAASFESKKRRKKKVKQQRGSESEDDDSDYVDDKDKDESDADDSDFTTDDRPSPKKKKKAKQQELPLIDSRLYAPLSFDSRLERSDRVSTSKVKHATENDDDDMYDADAEAPVRDVQKAFRSKKPATTKAPSEASSNSDTVITGKVKKKKKLKKLRQAHVDEAHPLDTIDSGREHHHPLPFKKRMAAVAAADSSLWDKHATSTVASKVSVSSAGTGPSAQPEFGTEASSISEFTHPLEAAMLPPPTFTGNNSFQRPSPVPREIVSKTTLLPPPHRSAFDFGVSSHNNVLGPTISSDDSDSESSSDSDTDEEELFTWANKMFGTTAKPPTKEENPLVVSSCAVEHEVNNLTPEMCEMERRRQKQEEARTLSIKEVNAIMKEELSNPAPAAEHWVRRSRRQPSRGVLNSPLVRRLLDKLRGNDNDMVVLKMKKYLSDPDTPPMLIDAALEALEENTNCEALYIQNFNLGMKDKQVLHLLRILQMPTCNIWCLNIGETYNVTEDTWELFAEGLKQTKVTHMYASEHTITAELKEEIRETIRDNRSKHNMHNDPNNLDVIVQCTHCWWNPINAKVLRPYLRKRGFESLLLDKEAQGLRGSMSEAPSA